MTGAREPAGPATADASETADAAFARALRRAATASSGAAGRPGQLRQEVTALLGPERAVAVRARLHRAVAAAEEHLPSTLVSLAPLTDETVARQAEKLAARRGWTAPAAAETVRDWAGALGLVTEPSVPNRPTQGALVAPDPATSPPPYGSELSVVWPTTRRMTRWLAGMTGLEHRAAAVAYAGISFRPYCLLMLILVLVVMPFALLLPGSRAGHANAVVSLVAGLGATVLTTRLQRGLLLATDHELVFVTFNKWLRYPKGERFTARWPAVRVVSTPSGGPLSTGEVRLGARRVQVGREGTDLLRAVERVCRTRS